MKYKGYKIEKSGGNYRVKTPSNTVWAELAVSVKTAKKWIDADINERRARQQSKG